MSAVKMNIVSTNITVTGRYSRAKEITVNRADGPRLHDDFVRCSSFKLQASNLAHSKIYAIYQNLGSYRYCGFLVLTLSF